MAGRAGGGDLEEGAAVRIETARFREVMGHLASGVAVVTGADGDGPFGFSCQAFMSLSLDPPLVALAPSVTSESWPRMRAVGSFCANILAEDQEAVCRVFATKGRHKFDGVGWQPGVTGAPRLAGALAWVECEIDDVHDGGDHVLVTARVEHLELAQQSGPSGRPLVFYRGGFGRFEA